MEHDIAQILVGEDKIRARIHELGTTISAHYQERGIDEISIICVTNGAVLFAADLMRRIDLYAKLDCVRVSSYRNEASPVGELEIIDHIRLPVPGQHLLLIDDILDTGQTLSTVSRILREQEPASLLTCVLLSKRGRRRLSIDADYVGFEVPDHFVVGYGLDFAERYRNLPYIGVLRPELQNPPEWQ